LTQSPISLTAARSRQKYLVIDQDLSEPDPLRLDYREVIEQTAPSVVMQTELDPLGAIRMPLNEQRPLAAGHMSNIVASTHYGGFTMGSGALCASPVRRLSGNAGVAAASTQ